jgi:two-component system response regulator YesN
VELLCSWILDGGDVQSRDTIADIKQYIAANLGKELSLTSLSEYTALSNSYISHIFKEKAGIGLVDYITQERMNRARELLAGTAQTIESISRQLGYHTPHYFAKRFRQYNGMTPHQYRDGVRR